MPFAIDWVTFWPSFWAALIATAKVFVVGGAGFVLVRKRWVDEAGLRALGQLVALLTLPCLIFYRFATRFDPQEFPDWPKYALIGAAITAYGLLMGKLVALRHGNDDEATMLVGFQNAGFFVLPMLQALLSPEDYQRGSLLLFVLIIPFNASLWACGSWLLLKRKGFSPQTLMTPPFVATVAAITLYSVFHDAMHRLDGTLISQILLGDEKSVGALQHIGDLTVPLATLTLGGSIAVNVRGRIASLAYKRAALESSLMRLILVPLTGYFILLWTLGPGTDYVVWLLLILQFASPPAIAISVFAQQHRYPMKYIPTACLISYILCLLTVPFFVALVPR